METRIESQTPDSFNWEVIDPKTPKEEVIAKILDKPKRGRKPKARKDLASMENKLLPDNGGSIAETIARNRLGPESPKQDDSIQTVKVESTNNAITQDQPIELDSTKELETQKPETKNTPNDNPNTPNTINETLPAPINTKKLEKQIAIQNRAQAYITQSLYSNTGIIEQKPPVDMLKRPDPAYKPIYAQMVKELIDNWPSFIETDVISRNSGNDTTTIKKRVPAPPITKHVICNYLGITEATLYRWSANNAVLRNIMQNNATKCTIMLTNHGLLKNYDSAFTQFVAKNVLNWQSTENNDKKGNPTNHSTMPDAVNESEEEIRNNLRRTISRVLGLGPDDQQLSTGLAVDTNDQSETT